MACKQQRFISHSPRSRCWQIQGLVRLHFLVHKQLSFNCDLPGSSFIRELIPFRRVPPSWPNHLSKTPPATFWGLGFQYMNLGRHKHSDHSNCLDYLMKGLGLHWVGQRESTKHWWNDTINTGLKGSKSCLRSKCVAPIGEAGSGEGSKLETSWCPFAVIQKRLRYPRR